MRFPLMLTLMAGMAVGAGCASTTRAHSATPVDGPGDPTVTIVSGDQARHLVTHGATLVDVRSEGEFNLHRIGHARNIPVEVLESRLDELGDRDRPVVVYCTSGHRAGRAAAILVQAGFTRVYDLGSMFSY